MSTRTATGASVAPTVPRQPAEGLAHRLDWPPATSGATARGWAYPAAPSGRRFALPATVAATAIAFAAGFLAAYKFFLFRNPAAFAMTAAAGANAPQRRPPRNGSRQPGSAPNRNGGWGRWDEQKPVQFDWTALPFPTDPKVAIIGGGISGLMLSVFLAKRHNIRSVVFDTGEHGPGGRLATRRSDDGSFFKNLSTGPEPSNPFIVDHAAQYFTATDEKFISNGLQPWEANGWIRRWEGPVGTVEGGVFEAFPDGDRWIAVGGFRRLAANIARDAERTGLVELRNPVWVSRMDGRKDGRWLLKGRVSDESLVYKDEAFDFAVVAHNGKCANRLMRFARGAPLVLQQLERLRLSAIWALLVVFPKSGVNAPFEGAFVKGSGCLAWAANNTAKHRSGNVEAWTLFSTPEYGRQNKVPQEAVPPEAAQRVCDEMLAAFARALGRDAKTLPKPVTWRVQMWGAALPTNAPKGPARYILDAASRTAVCGDWLYGPPSIQSAVLSADALADAIAGLRGCSGAAAHALSANLTVPFVSTASASTALGDFPH
eukprot:EG_transcript_7861